MPKKKCHQQHNLYIATRALQGCVLKFLNRKFKGMKICVSDRNPKRSKHIIHKLTRFQVQTPSMQKKGKPLNRFDKTRQNMPMYRCHQSHHKLALVKSWLRRSVVLADWYIDPYENCRRQRYHRAFLRHHQRQRFPRF